MHATNTPNACTPAQHPATTPNPKTAAFSTMSFIVLAFSLAGYMTLMIAYIVAAPLFREYFNNFDTDLPALTFAILREGNVVIAGHILMVIGLIVKEFLPFFNSKVKLTLNFVALLLIPLILFLYLIGIYLPFTQIQQSVM